MDSGLGISGDYDSGPLVMVGTSVCHEALVEEGYEWEGWDVEAWTASFTLLSVKRDCDLGPRAATAMVG